VNESFLRCQVASLLSPEPLATTTTPCSPWILPSRFTAFSSSDRRMKQGTWQYITTENHSLYLRRSLCPCLFCVALWGDNADASSLQRHELGEKYRVSIKANHARRSFCALALPEAFVCVGKLDCPYFKPHHAKIKDRAWAEDDPQWLQIDQLILMASFLEISNYSEGFGFRGLQGGMCTQPLGRIVTRDP